MASYRTTVYVTPRKKRGRGILPLQYNSLCYTVRSEDGHLTVQQFMLHRKKRGRASYRRTVYVTPQEDCQTEDVSLLYVIFDI